MKWACQKLHIKSEPKNHKHTKASIKCYGLSVELNFNKVVYQLIQHGKNALYRLHRVHAKEVERK